MLLFFAYSTEIVLYGAAEPLSGAPYKFSWWWRWCLSCPGLCDSKKFSSLQSLLSIHCLSGLHLFLLSAVLYETIFMSRLSCVRHLCPNSCRSLPFVMSTTDLSIPNGVWWSHLWSPAAMYAPLNMCCCSTLW